MLTTTRVERTVVLLIRDEAGVTRTERVKARVALCRGLLCGRRWRVLPCDVLPGKTFSLPVIESVAAQYSKGDQSLRTVAWSIVGDRTPAHTTLHGWTEGIGAHVLGRPSGGSDGSPFTRLLVESEKHAPSLVESDRKPDVDPRRYRSEARRDRLQAMAFALAAALVVTGVAVPAALSEWRRQAVAWLAASVLGFRSRISCTPFEHVVPSARQRCAPRQEGRAGECQARTRSPPSGSSRSRR